MLRSPALVSTRVVKLVAQKRDADPKGLPPLYESIDPSALDALYARADTTQTGRRTDPTVQFSYAGYEVRVRSATDIEVREPTEDAPGN